MTDPLSTEVTRWPRTAYMVPWLNGGCPWVMDFMSAFNQSAPVVCFWAFARSRCRRNSAARLFYKDADRTMNLTLEQARLPGQA
jgi:hypothetical protein